MRIWFVHSFYCKMAASFTVCNCKETTKIKGFSFLNVIFIMNFNHTWWFWSVNLLLYIYMHMYFKHPFSHFQLSLSDTFCALYSSVLFYSSQKKMTSLNNDSWSFLRGQHYPDMWLNLYWHNLPMRSQKSDCMMNSLVVISSIITCNKRTHFKWHICDLCTFFNIAWRPWVWV